MLKIFSSPVSSASFVVSAVSAVGAVSTMVSSGASQMFAGLFLSTMFFFVVGKMTK